MRNNRTREFSFWLTASGGKGKLDLLFGSRILFANRVHFGVEGDILIGEYNCDNIWYAQECAPTRRVNARRWLPVGTPGHRMQNPLGIFYNFDGLVEGGKSPNSSTKCYLMSG